MLVTILLLTGILSASQPVVASDENSKAIAMQLAEQQTNAKAVRAKFKKTANSSGFRVRLMKDGKVIHTFIPMQRIKKK